MVHITEIIKKPVLTEKSITLMDEENKYTLDYYKDEVAPKISIDEKYNALPNGVVGCNYPIPEATANDQISGDCKVDTKVYFNYGTNKQVDVQIKNGKFACSQTGTYTIEFTAKDAVGNKDVVTRNVSIVDTIPLVN